MNEDRKEAQSSDRLPPEVGLVRRIADQVNIHYKSDPEFRKQVFNAIMELYYARIYYERNYDRSDCDCDCGCDCDSKKEE